LYSKLHAGLEKTEPPGEVDTLIKNEMLDHVIANQVATAIALVYISHSLSLHPHWQQKLRKELVQLSRDDETNNLSPRALDALPILDAIIMESLRLYSPNPGPWPRHNPSSPTQIGQYSNIPPGTTISASSYTLHRNETAFPEPEKWRPERWLEATDEGRAEMMRWFWAFGSGTHMCIGSNLALLSKLSRGPMTERKQNAD
jgi:cytochrome P450